MDNDVEMIKKMILQQIKPINFGDELNLDDILGEDIIGDGPSDTPNSSVPSNEISTPLKTVENVVCPVCSKMFTNLRYFKKHFTKHTGRFSCPSCKKKFSRKETKLKHIPRCKSNNQIAKAKKKLPKNEEAPKHHCEICSKNFTRKQNYEQHIMVHSGVQVICNICQKKLSSFKSYQRHKKIHEYPKHKIACQICPSEFSLKSNLLRHIKLYQHKNQMIWCYKCNKNVKTDKNLQRHLSQNTTSTCSLCSGIFCLESDLKSHFKKDHPNLWFKCKACTNTPFMTRFGTNLQEHAKKHHSIELSGDEFFKDGWFMIISS